jgi:thymidylate kinase
MWRRLYSVLDEAVDDRVLVFGALPPEGRDLDLLAREAEERALAAKLAAEGFEQRGVQWARFEDCTVVAVDLVPAGEWGLPAAELAALFDDATPLKEHGQLVVPAPHHALLIAARRVARSGAYGARLRGRIDEIASRMPAAWEEAQHRAAAWNAVRELSQLRALHDSGAQPAPAARLRALGRRATTSPDRGRAARSALGRLARRPAIVALSGLDGAGKSFQAQRLADELERLGIDAAVIWPAAANVMFQANPALKRGLRRVLAALGRSSPSDHPGDPAQEPLPSQAAPVAHALALVVAIVQAWSFRRGGRRIARGVDVVIYDRYALDSVVYVRHRWGQGRPLRLQSRLIQSLSRRPAVAFLLDVAPEVAYERKHDFPLDDLRARGVLYRELHATLGVTRLDGERPPEDLCAVIARAVWRRVG